MKHAFVRPVWHRDHDDALGVDRARVVGYRAATSDGHAGKVHSTYAAAQAAARALNAHERVR